MSRGALNISVDKKKCYRQPHFDYWYEAKKTAKLNGLKIKRCPFCSTLLTPQYILTKSR